MSNVPKSPAEDRVNFGKHRGTTWPRVPAAYLQWMVQVDHSQRERAEAELERRGTVQQKEFDISPHAIDRASQRMLALWQATREENEGLYTWLYNRCKHVLQKTGARNTETATTTVIHEGFKYVFAWEGEWPTLKTVIKTKST